MSLLEKALASKGPRKRGPVDADELELAVAFFRGDVTHTQCGAAMGKASPNSAIQSLIAAFRNACIAGRIRIEVLPSPGEGAQ